MLLDDSPLGHRDRCVPRASRHHDRVSPGGRPATTTADDWAQAAIDEEGKRVQEEIDRIGEQPWCDAQRDKLEADELGIFVN